LITNVTYQIDEQVVILYEPTPSEYLLPATKQFSIDLKGLTGGQHKLQVKVTAESQYCPHDVYYFFLLERYPLNVSHTIVFNVEPSPTTIVTLVAVVATGSGLSAAYYLRKRKNNNHSTPITRQTSEST
jgi:hypothetical protein